MRMGDRRSVGAITVVSVENANSPGRVGLVVGKQVGDAVRRNRAKRRLRAASRQVEWAEGKDHVVIATRQVLEANFQDLVVWLSVGAQSEGHRS